MRQGFRVLPILAAQVLLAFVQGSSDQQADALHGGVRAVQRVVLDGPEPAGAVLLAEMFRGVEIGARSRGRSPEAWEDRPSALEQGGAGALDVRRLRCSLQRQAIPRRPAPLLLEGVPGRMAVGHAARRSEPDVARRL